MSCPIGPNYAKCEKEGTEHMVHSWLVHRRLNPTKLRVFCEVGEDGVPNITHEVLP